MLAWPRFTCLGPEVRANPSAARDVTSLYRPMNAAHVTQHSAGRVREVSSCCISLVARCTFFPDFLRLASVSAQRNTSKQNLGDGRCLLRAGLPSGGRQNGRISRRSYHSTPDTRLARANTHSDLGGVTLCHLLSRSFSVTWIGAARCCHVYPIKPYSSLFTFARAPKSRTVTFFKTIPIIPFQLTRITIKPAFL